ncbi:hypothetical protein IC232_13800 [Microvirga sp. BT688]|uniref:hypothetical protein n=1 Tax=Microvirga sp. TaxID=1873136 RepID=UPI001685C19A|nr:hypothetical protein [Microvirga sp.]MBD2747773.1 hypothetical protein [Microvirga sp.]
MARDNIIDARRRFPNPDVQGTDGTNAAEFAANRRDSLQLTRARLDEADRIADDLRSRPRVPVVDRPRLARNLGRMVEAAGESQILAHINSLFEATFGAEGAVNALKKRKRYLRLSSEALPPADLPGEYHAGGADFVQLARQWADLKPSAHLPHVDARRQAVLNLVEGTTFDTRARAALRRSETGRREFIERMGDVLTTIEAAVDLDQYFDAACSLRLTATVTEGDYADAGGGFFLQNNTAWHDLRLREPDTFDTPDSDVVGPSGEDGDRHGNTHFLAPKVLLGFMLTPIEMEDPIPYRVEPSLHLVHHDDALVASLLVRFGPDGLTIYESAVAEYRENIEALPDYDWLDMDEHMDHEDARRACDLRLRQRLQAELHLPETPPELHDVEVERIRKALVTQHGPQAARLIDDASSGSSDDWWALWHSLSSDEVRPVVWVAHAVMLSIYRERATGRPRLALTVSPDESRLEHTMVLTHLPRRSAGRSLRLGTIDDSQVSYIESPVGDGYLVWGDEFDLRLNAKFDFAKVLHLLPSNAALELAFLPLGRPSEGVAEAVFKPLFDDRPSAFSPAPINTLAGAILRNLAHAPAGQRLDELLLTDVRAKAEAMRAVVDREEQSYRKGIERLMK